MSENFMTLRSRLRSWFRSILQRSRTEREMDAELRFHIEAYAEDLTAYAVSTRPHEIGIWMLLGALPIQVLRLVLGETATLFVFGSAVGLVLTLAVGQMNASVVYETQPHDPLVMASVVTAIALLGLSASWSPARRATRVNPMVALRHE
jgi:ABC-type antimicrobial peptide transport system permease subunit